ncbi:MAG: thioredoxin-disulfide reductase [Dehalococcoidales bacterium]|nr:thioredoxin-disulfide reductase [Dehalococcoidales bacterium]
MDNAAPNSYEAIIIGGGPAGLTAGLYTARARISSLLIEKGAFGGQMINAVRLDNYPGFPDGINGSELAELMLKQATKYGLETIIAEVTGLKFKGEDKIVETSGGTFTAKTVIITGGSNRRKLGVPGEEQFTGKGVSYCATCDAAFFRGLPVALIGGGNSAISEALHLAKSASRVTVIHRRNQLRATPILQEKAFAEPKIDFRLDSIVESIEGKDSVQRIRLHQTKTGERSTLEVSGVFISIGFIPNTGYLKGILPLANDGSIITNNRMETGVAGIFAAGDIRQKTEWQAITAAGDGATAAINVEKFLS